MSISPARRNAAASGRAALEEERLDAFRGERRELLDERPGAELELRAFRQGALAERESARLALGADLLAAVGRILGADSAHAHRDSVGPGPQLVHVATALLARDPARVAARRGTLPSSVTAAL